MQNLRFEERTLVLLALFMGLALWTPAIGIPVYQLPFQPMDFLVLAGIPLLIVFRKSFLPDISKVTALLIGSFLLSLWAGGSTFILAYYSLLILPFVLLIYLIITHKTAQQVLVSAFLVGGLLSCLFFLTQIIFGAERLDFRTNILFQLPPHFGRGFALFPEVSTFAAHGILVLGILFARIFNRATLPGNRQLMTVFLILVIVSLMFSRSTSFLIVAPFLVVFAVTQATRINLNTVLLILLLSILVALILAYFLNTFYADRLATSSATRSASMRLASVLGGLSPLYSGEFFGVGLGNNDLVKTRAYEIARLLDLRHGRLPTGINSLTVGRIFEEGWPAVLQLSLSGLYLMRAGLIRNLTNAQVALLVLAVGSFLLSLLVIGYRGIYTNWLWIAIPPALLATQSISPMTPRMRRVKI